MSGLSGVTRANDRRNSSVSLYVGQTASKFKERLSLRLKAKRSASHIWGRTGGRSRARCTQNLGIQPLVIITKSCRTCKKQSPGMRVVSHRLVFNGAFFSVVRVELGFRESRAYIAGKKQISRRRMRMRHFGRGPIY